jgi:predicted GH43/DUF377 family glycosyl hydrolase
LRTRTTSCGSPSDLAISERIIFPVAPSETNGIEDARFVRFVEDDGAVTYYATYTAYNGVAILPQLIRTDDFQRFRMLTMGGTALQNKGMALFPRRVGGRYMMLSRQDDENIHLMRSTVRITGTIRRLSCGRARRGNRARSATAAPRSRQRPGGS